MKTFSRLNLLVIFGMLLMAHTNVFGSCNAGFTYQNTGGNTFQFTNTSSSTNGYRSDWTFYAAGGTVGFSSQQNPQFTFSGPLPFMAFLIITDSLGQCEDSVFQQLNGGGICLANAAFSHQNINGNLVQFTNTSNSTNGFLSNWTFYNAGGQSGSSAVVNPQFTFTGSAPFKARLIITDTAGHCSDTVQQQIDLNSANVCITLQPDSTGDKTTEFNSGYPNLNLCTSTWVLAAHWTGNGNPVESRGLINFDLSQIPTGAVITSASLSLYADVNNLHDGYLGTPMWGTNNATYIRKVTSPWTDNLVTWNNQPTATTVGQVLLPQSTSTTQDYPNNDITAFVQDWVNNPSQNYGMELYMQGTAYYNSMIFCSSHNPNAAKRPKLEICYLVPCNAEANFVHQDLGNATAQFTNLSSSDNGYTSSWTFYNANGPIGTSTATNPVEIFTGQPPYSARLIISDSTAGCSDTLTRSLNMTICLTLQPDSTGDKTTEFNSGYPNLNLCTSTWVLAAHWTGNGNPVESRGLINFDLTQIPAGANVLNASLSLYADVNNLHDGYLGTPMWGTNNATYIRKVTSPWTDNLVTWNNQPTTTTAGQVLLPQSTSTTQDYPNNDITGFVQGWVNNPGQNYGMELYMQGTAYYNSMIFCSSHNPNAAKRPKLEICYNTANCNAVANFNYQDLSGNLATFANSSTSTNGYVAQWSFYNANGLIATSTAASPQQQFTGLPPYTATLLIIDSLSGCSDSVSQLLQLNGCLILQPDTTGCKTVQFNTGYPHNSFYDSEWILSAHWTGNSIPVESRSLIAFDLSQIPVGSTITSATISLYANTNNTHDGYLGTPMWGTDNASYLQPVTSPWTDYLTNWYTQPTADISNNVLLPQSVNTTQDYPNIDISTFVQYWVNNPSQNFGMRLIMRDNFYYNSLIFCSSRYPDPTKRPKLEICYTTNSSPCSAIFNYAAHANDVSFTNQPHSNGSTIIWDFGDGSTSSLDNPVHVYSQNGSYQVTLTVQNGADTCSSTGNVFISRILNDTLCGMVFNDVNTNGLFDLGETPIANAAITVDGNNYTTDNSGYYHAVVTGGVHHISQTTANGWTQTYPVMPSYYIISTTNNNYICGLDFGVANDSLTGLQDISAVTGGLFIYPNPTNGTHFSVSVPAISNNEATQVTVLDILGKEIGQLDVQKQDGSFMLSLPNDVEAGVYTVVVKSAAKSWCGKVMVIK